jgi:hypothetical protein
MIATWDCARSPLPVTDRVFKEVFMFGNEVLKPEVIQFTLKPSMFKQYLAELAKITKSSFLFSCLIEVWRIVHNIEQNLDVGVITFFIVNQPKARRVTAILYDPEPIDDLDTYVVEMVKSRKKAVALIGESKKKEKETEKGKGKLKR